jgi:chromosome segregation ATPase
MSGGKNRAVFVALLVTTLGLWGCTQNRGDGSGLRVRDLEARNAKLEEDYQSAVSEGADLRRKLSAAEKAAARAAQMMAQLQGLSQERDRLTGQLATAQNERSVLQGQMQQFSRDLQSLLGRVDAAAGSGAQAVNASGGA